MNTKNKRGLSGKYNKVNTFTQQICACTQCPVPSTGVNLYLEQPCQAQVFMDLADIYLLGFVSDDICFYLQATQDFLP